MEAATADTSLAGGTGSTTLADLLPRAVAKYGSAAAIKFKDSSGKWVDRSFEQNVGFRIAYSVIHFRAVTNPKDFSGDAEFTIGISMPRRTYPWQDPQETEGFTPPRR